MRFGLDRMHKLMTALGMPQRRFASVHVVGTNGKSSTTRFTAAILEREGLATGIYTSPHLRGFPERIEIRERPLGDAEFAEAVARAALVVPPDLDPAAAAVAERVRDERHAHLLRAESDLGLPLAARGAFQRHNFALAAAAAGAFLERAPDVEALRAAAAETSVPGR